MSGGVIIAEIAVIINKAYLRYFESIIKSIIPIFAKIQINTGSWNTIPIINVRDVNVEIYELSEIKFSIDSDTLYVPKNRNEIGNITK